MNLSVIQTAGTALQNKYPPTQQYVTRRKEVALLNKRAELFCIYGGTCVILYLIIITIQTFM